MTRIAWGQPTRSRKTDHVGARAFVYMSTGKWNGHYEIDSHGKSSGEMAAQIEELRARHDRWAALMDRLQELSGVDLRAGAATFRIVDCTIPPQTKKEHELIVCVRLVDGDALRRVDGWPLIVPLRSIDECPTNDRILELVTEKLGAQRTIAEAHADFVAKVARKIAR